MKALATDLSNAIDSVCLKAAQAANDNYQIIVLSDKKAGKRLIPIRYKLVYGFTLIEHNIPPPNYNNMIT